MGLYVETMCDVRDETPLYEGSSSHRCDSYNSDNPQGHSIKEARQAARRAGWVVIGDWCCCVGCKETEAGAAAIKATKARRLKAQP